MHWREDILSALNDFEMVSELAGEPLIFVWDNVEFCPAPHERPKKLPVGRAAVYGFWCHGEWLKIGQVGPKSNARYTSQHYTGSANSTLAGALRGDAEWAKRVANDVDAEAPAGITKDFTAEWIEHTTSRVNILLPPNHDALRRLLEAFLHVRLRPKYEG